MYYKKPSLIAKPIKLVFPRVKVILFAKRKWIEMTMSNTVKFT